MLTCFMLDPITCFDISVEEVSVIGGINTCLYNLTDKKRVKYKLFLYIYPEGVIRRQQVFFL